MGSPIGAVPIESMRLEVRIEPDGSLATGTLGAAIAPLAILGAIGRIGASLDEPTIRSVVHPDLEPNADASECARVSLGVGIALVPAVIVH